MFDAPLEWMAQVSPKVRQSPCHYNPDQGRDHIRVSEFYITFKANETNKFINLDHFDIFDI